MDDLPGFIYHCTPLTVQSCLAPVYEDIYLGTTLYQKLCFCKMYFCKMYVKGIFLPELLLWCDEAGVEDVGKSCTREGVEKNYSECLLLKVLSRRRG